MSEHLPYSADALRHLRRKDRALRAVIDRIGPFALRRHRNRFVLLARAIVSQQISTRAAETISARLLKLIAPARLSAEAVRGLTSEQLRSVGLSRQKAVYMHDLAEKVADGTVALRALHRADDEEVIRRLVLVKGIGRWTAEMFLIFCLGRPDVLPVDDLGLRVGVQRLDGLAEPPRPAEVRARGAVWAPYRSVATWYLWQSLKPTKPRDESASPGDPSTPNPAGSQTRLPA